MEQDDSAGSIRVAHESTTSNMRVNWGVPCPVPNVRMNVCPVHRPEMSRYRVYNRRGTPMFAKGPTSGVPFGWKIRRSHLQPNPCGFRMELGAFTTWCPKSCLLGSPKGRPMLRTNEKLALERTLHSTQAPCVSEETLSQDCPQQLLRTVSFISQPPACGS